MVELFQSRPLRPPDKRILEPWNEVIEVWKNGDSSIVEMNGWTPLGRALFEVRTDSLGRLNVEALNPEAQMILSNLQTTPTDEAMKKFLERLKRYSL
ncbi:hypothetical protein IPA_03845 [Ignicoccus pacificus DSM 13166]|uniref:Uncharacterized protein n=1 Tax=Ignicoccus pacificus DSM 13166 TaxID=940294 RepID=A0A977KB32_9CREN|nr:hypothetical protein IPA_03845 [Ignicoccus pacificus DSM 13166]